MNGRLLTVAYDGTNYSGFQYQANGLAVQQVLEETLARLEQKPVRIKGASRTDAGVHAQGQRVFYVSQNALPKAAYIKGANALLPPDIAIVDMREVSEHFNPRLTAGKIYRYTLHCAHMRDPLRVRTEWTLYRQLNVPAMQQAATHLVGTHDFSAFQAADCERDNAIRTILRLNIRENGSRLEILVAGTAFLKNMVRIIVGTLVDVGMGRFSPEDVLTILRSRDRTKAGMTAPAAGLCLMNVFYPDEPQNACLMGGNWPDWS